jgi:hypothetical protein
MEVKMKVDDILKERQATYGDPADNFFQMGRIWGAILDIDDIPAWQVALMMDGFKTVRCAANPRHKDSWLDKAGYMQIGMRLALEEPEFSEELAEKNPEPSEIFKHLGDQGWEVCEIYPRGCMESNHRPAE